MTPLHTIRATSGVICALLLCLVPPFSRAAQRSSAPNPAAPSSGYRIAGVVVDASTGVPIPGAELSIAESTLEMNVTADGSGRFAFSGVDPGKYSVYASAPGYVHEGLDEHRGFLTSTAVGAGLDSEHIVFRLHRQVVIFGTVTDERGEPVRNAQVLLFLEDQEVGKRTTRQVSMKQANDLGAYRFAHLKAGRYFVAVSARPWYAQNMLSAQPGTQGEQSQARKTQSSLDVVYPMTFYPGVTDDHAAAELSLSPGDTQQADIRLQAVPALHLRLNHFSREESDTPGVRAGIGVGASQTIFGSANTGLGVVFGEVAPGVFEIGGLPPGNLTLTLNEQQGGRWEARSLNVSATEDEVLDASTQAGAVPVSGKVLVAPGRFDFSGDVALDGKLHQTQAKLQKDGSFTFSNVLPDTYEVLVNVNADAYPEKITANGAKVSDREIIIDGSSDVQLLIRMGQGFGEIKGVVNSGGKPQAGVLVLLVPAASANLERYTRMDQSDSDGTFTLGRIFPGKYVLMAIQDGWDLEWANPDVLRPLREKGQIIDIAPNDLKKVEVQEIPNLKPGIAK